MFQNAMFKIFEQALNKIVWSGRKPTVYKAQMIDLDQPKYEADIYVQAVQSSTGLISPDHSITEKFRNTLLLGRLLLVQIYRSSVPCQDQWGCWVCRLVVGLRGTSMAAVTISAVRSKDALWRI